MPIQNGKDKVGLKRNRMYPNTNLILIAFKNIVVLQTLGEMKYYIGNTCGQM